MADLRLLPYLILDVDGSAIVPPPQRIDLFIEIFIQRCRIDILKEIIVIVIYNLLSAG
jgi:hypothetical protein